MREFRLLATVSIVTSKTPYELKQQLEAERWREQSRPVAMRLFAARTAKLHGSRALLRLLVEELDPDDLFTELMGRTTTRGHHDADCSARLDPVKALRFAPTRTVSRP